jgi:hypothetical protein
VARRGGQTALRGSWAFGTPTSTFVYTTIFAAGLAIDARAKAARNKQWEQAFAHLEEAAGSQPSREGAKETEAATESAHPPYYHGVHLANLPRDLDWAVMGRIVGMELEDDEILQAKEIRSQIRDYAEMDWDDLRFDSRYPGAQALEWPANTGPDLVRYNLPPQSLWAPDVLRLAAMRRRHTWKKLAMQNLSAGFLVHRLLRGADVARFSATASDEFTKLAPQIQKVIAMTAEEDQAARLEILEAIEYLQRAPVDSPTAEIDTARIRVDHPAIPSYRQDADGDFYGITKQLNQGLRRLLQNTDKGNDRKQALALTKICHNLLVSSASPDLQTFNTLLAGFRRWHRPASVDSVIAAFYTHKIRPNEITCREILGHYAFELRADDFSRFVAKMRGVGDALTLANPNITVNEASQGRLVRINQEKVYQKVYPTPIVFGALMSGVMRFAGFDRALDIYYEMKADGWGLDVPGLTKLLADCVRRADWEGGLYVWEEINSIKTKAKTHDMAGAYNHMLSLCSITGNTVAFNQILNDLAKGGFDRKAIIDAATKTTRWAQSKKGTLAPAWVVDNVMIAVADYMHDVKSSDPVNVADMVNSDDAMFKQHGPDVTEAAKSSTEDKKDLWAAWVEHEFGERPKDSEP